MDKPTAAGGFTLCSQGTWRSGSPWLSQTLCRVDSLVSDASGQLQLQEQQRDGRVEVVEQRRTKLEEQTLWLLLRAESKEVRVVHSDFKFIRNLLQHVN